MDNEVMSNEENYAFDVAGYLHIPGVLSQEEVAALNAALDAIEDSETLLGGSSSAPRIVPRLTGTSKIGVVFEPDCRTTVSDSIKPLNCWEIRRVKSVQHSSVAMNREIHPWHIANKTVSGVVRA